MDDTGWAMTDGTKGKGTPTRPWVAGLHATLSIVTPLIALAAGIHEASLFAYYSVSEPHIATRTSMHPYQTARFGAFFRV